VIGVRAFFDRWYPPLVRFLFARLGDSDLAEDIAQEAFVRLLDRDPRDPQAWLFAVAANLATDHSRVARGRARHLALVARDEASDEDPAAALLRAERIGRVRRALGKLSERDRTLLLLHNEGFSYADLARHVGVAPSSVGPLLARAQRRFTKSYELHEHEEGRDARHASG
jgi:RNA polymerase sigma factor (sigma-70 family)